MKTCTKCKQEFPATLEYFYKEKQGKYFQSYCKFCMKEIGKAWRKTNSEKVNEASRVWRKENPEKFRASYKAYENANPEKVKAKNKAWSLANPEKRSATTRRRRAKKLGNGFESYTLKEIFKLYGTNCYLCDMPINLKVSGKSGSNPQWRSGLHIEHFIDIALGGPDTLENVRPSHGWCNLTKPQRGKDSVELSNGTI